MRRSFADLIRREVTSNGPCFRVIDIKATRSARAFHKTQVAFYALLLRTILSEIGNAGSVDPQGEVWRIPDDGNAEDDAWVIEEFALAPFLRLVEDFCGTTLPTIASKVVAPGRDETFFHVYFKCEQCAYLPHCIQAVGPARSSRVRDVSAVPGLSHEAKRTLLSIEVGSVDQLAALGGGVGRIDGVGWSLSRHADLLVSRARALREGSVQSGPEPHSFLMPPRADAAVYLVADHDPVDDTLVTLGYRYVDEAGVRDHIEVLPTADRVAEADALVRVFGRLIADLQAIDFHNVVAADKGGPTPRTEVDLRGEVGGTLTLQKGDGMAFEQTPIARAGSEYDCLACKSRQDSIFIVDAQICPGLFAIILSDRDRRQLGRIHDLIPRLSFTAVLKPRFNR